MKLFGILRKPNRLDELASSDRTTSFWRDVRNQIKVLHCIGVSYVVLFCLAVNFSSVFLGLPTVFQDNEDRLFFAQLFMWIICFNIISNFLLILFHGRKSAIGSNTGKGLPFKASKHDSLLTPDEGKHDWHYCSHCEIYVPPRARHCSICRACILKKDHHCFFTGTCIGFYNQKYFIIFNFYGIVGGSWGLYNLGTYLSANYAPIIGLQVYRYLLPYVLVASVGGVETFSNACLVLLFYLHITSTSASLYYFWWQMFIIQRGQTSYECVKGIKIYKDDFWNNMRSVFGPYWLISFIIPMPVLLNVGDGLSWHVDVKSQ